MQIDILTIFPKMFDSVFGESIIKRAQKKGKVKIRIYDLRKFSTDKHKKVDDRPFGGGPGMVMKPEPIFKAIQTLKYKVRSKKYKVKIILLTPSGKKLNQQIIKNLSKSKHLILICGHYEGVDERVKDIITDEITVGDYVLTGGEIPAMALVDSIIRLLPGVLGDSESAKAESFSSNLLEYPQYTRPANFEGKKVPDELLCGNHELIRKWRRQKAVEITLQNRPDLIKNIEDLEV